MLKVTQLLLCWGQASKASGQIPAATHWSSVPHCFSPARHQWPAGDLTRGALCQAEPRGEQTTEKIEGWVRATCGGRG